MGKSACGRGLSWRGLTHRGPIQPDEQVVDVGEIAYEPAHRLGEFLDEGIFAGTPGCKVLLKDLRGRIILA